MIRSETSQFINELEHYSNRKLTHPLEVGQLVEIARQTNKVELLEDAVFQAKFITKSYGVMKRIGADAEGYVKLSGEFQASLEKASTLLRTLIKESPDEIKNHFVQTFFSLKQESLSHLMELLNDLTVVKNWMLDGKPLP